MRSTFTLCVPVLYDLFKFTMSRWLERGSLFSGHAPMIVPSFPLAPSVCADVHVAARAHLDEREIDSVVRNLLQRAGSGVQDVEQAHSSRLCCLLVDVCKLLRDDDPLEALGSAVRELKGTREHLKQLLHMTRESNVHAALARVKIVCGGLSGSDMDGASASGTGRSRASELVMELQSLREQQQQLITFVGLKVPKSSDALEQAAEAAFSRLKQRERERLKLLRLRNDVLGAAANAEEAGGESRPQPPHLQDPNPLEEVGRKHGATQLLRAPPSWSEYPVATALSAYLADAW